MTLCWGSDMGRFAHPQTTYTKVVGQLSLKDPRPSIICQFSGHHLVLQGLETPPNKHLLLIVKPSTVLRHIQHILDLRMFWRQHIPHLSLILWPIHEITQKFATHYWRESLIVIFRNFTHRKQSSKSILAPHSKSSPWPHLAMLPGVSEPKKSLSGLLWGLD